MNPSITPAVSDGQKNQFANVLADAMRKATGTVIDELCERGVLNHANFQKVVERGDQVTATVLQAVRVKLAELAENIKGYLRLISGAEKLVVPATTGKRTIAKSEQLFTGYLDSDFKRWGLDSKSSPTPEMPVEVHEMVKNGTFAQIYGGMNVDLNKLVLTQDQIVSFVETHRKWLRADGYGTFFLFKEKVEDEEQFFVADVHVNGRGLDVYVDRFSYGHVWHAGYRLRFVIPQLVA